jgi:hypothetical protein
MTRDHQILIGWDHPGADAARRASDAWAARHIRPGVKLDTEPRRPLADPAPDLDRMLADAGREDERVEAARAPIS